MNNLNVNKIISVSTGKVPSCYLKKILRRIEGRKFSLGSRFFNKIIETKKTEVSTNNEETSLDFDSSCLQPVPKKSYGLSKVEEKDVELVESLKKGNIFYPYKGPYERCGKILAEDFKCTFRRMLYSVTGIRKEPLYPVFFPRYTDILIIGGGIFGLTIAYTIKEKFPHGPEVFVVDKDCNFPPLSTNMTQGMVTNQLFTDEEEIPMLKYGAEFFSSFSQRTEIDGVDPFGLCFEPLGSMVLVDESNLDRTLSKIEMLKKYEIYNKIVDKETLEVKFPWLKANDILFGSLGMGGEGLVNPWMYLHGLKAKCMSLGVQFIHAEVIDFGFKENIPFRVACKLPDGSYNSIDYSRCVVACGMEALNLTELLNESDKIDLVVKFPLQERMKYEYCFYNPDGPGLNTPIIIDANGTYFRRDGLTGYYVIGVSPVPFNDTEENDPKYIYHNKVIPFIKERLPQPEKFKLVKGWADLHEHCYSNDIGVLGRHPQVDNITFALGFSHLGLQYMPALARAVMENMIYEEYTTIDFTPFHIENLWKKQHLEADRRRREMLENERRVPLPNKKSEVKVQN